jgi:hypothetical protein
MCSMQPDEGCDMSDVVEQSTGVFIDGDPSPIRTTIGVLDVAARIAFAAVSVDSFIQLPMDGGVALVRPRSVVAILPMDEDEDED